jgi:hypothetical protein
MTTIQGHSFSSRQIEQMVSASTSSTVVLSLWDRCKDLFVANTKRAAVEAIFAELERLGDGSSGAAGRKIERFHALASMAKPEHRHQFSVQIDMPTASEGGSTFKWKASFSVAGVAVGTVEVAENQSLNGYRAAYASEAIAAISHHLDIPEGIAQRHIGELCSTIENGNSNRELIATIFNRFSNEYAHAIQNNLMASDIATNAATMLDGVTAPLAIARDFHRVTKQDLRPGDILLLVDEPEHTTFKHGVITFGQALSSLSVLRDNCGDANLVHAVMWVKSPHNRGRTHVADMGEPEISEVRGGTRLCAQNTALRTGRYIVYRPTKPDLGDWSAQIAMLWADPRNIKYNTSAAAKSIVGNSTFGNAAANRMEQYQSEAFDTSPNWGSDGAFCSQFIAAVLQAACKSLEYALPKALTLDARNTSVRTLEHFLKSDPETFKRLGEICIEPDQVLYND